MILLEGGKDLEKYDGILSWCPDGKSFIINSTTLLVDILLPEYFASGSKLTSFFRKVGDMQAFFSFSLRYVY